MTMSCHPWRVYRFVNKIQGNNGGKKYEEVMRERQWKWLTCVSFTFLEGWLIGACALNKRKRNLSIHKQVNRIQVLLHECKLAHCKIVGHFVKTLKSDQFVKSDHHFWSFCGYPLDDNSRIAARFFSRIL